MNILLIRLRLIGDVLFTTPAIRALRRRFPDARLAYLVEPAAAPVVRGNPHLDEVIIAPKGRGLARLWQDAALARRLRAARYDLVIDFHGGPRSSVLAWTTRAAERIGYEIAGRGWMYTRRIARPRAPRARHSVQNQWDLLAALGIDPPDRRRDAAEMANDPVVASAVDRRLQAAGLRPDRDRPIVIHVSAGNPFRRWPLGSFVDLVTSLVAADPRRRVILTAGPSEAQAAAEVARDARARLGSHADAVADTGEFDLTELRALFERAALYIGGDSGPLHVASATKVPIVGLYGPTLPVRSAPWRDPALVTESVEYGDLPCRPCDQRRCDPGDFRCLTRISPQAVAAAAERALAQAASEAELDRIRQ